MKKPFARMAQGAVLALLAACAAARAEAPFSLASTPGQLPKTVVPVHYSLTLKPDMQALVFQGRETVDIKVLAPTRRLVLNQLGLQVSAASLAPVGDSRRSERPSVQTDDAAQTLTLTFPAALPVGPYRLTLAYSGRIGQQGQGLYVVRYRSGHGERQMLATQMEATDARRMFPGWDEPAFRATFRMNAVVPRPLMAVSNTPVTRETRLPGGLKEVSFGQTPPMASYLVVLVIGDLEAIGGEAAGVKLRVVTVRGKKQQGRYAMGVMQKILPYYDSYFGVRYPLPKLDLIAVPGGFGGAMENWGGIVYNEGTLLFDPASSPESSKRLIFSVVSHETAHQWFGDLVTMAWWDDLWLNEGFASWMAYKASDHFNPQWHVWEDAAADKSQVMGLDAVHAAHPIQQPVADPTQAAGAFDDITYEKGAAVIHMFEASLGEAPFRAGIRRYMAAHAYSNTTTADLWDALQAASGQPVRRIAPGWTRQPGFPVVRVRPAPDGSGVVLTQQPFALDAPTPLPRRWQVPVVWEASGAGGTCRQTVLLGTNPLPLAVRPGEVVRVNAGNTGYYRVEYDPALLAPLAARVETLPGEDRVGLLGDTWALAEAGRASMGDYLTLAQSCRFDTRLAVVDQVTNSLDTVRLLERGRDGQAAFETVLRSLRNAQFAPVGWDARPGEPDSTALRRGQLIRSLGRLGDPAVTAEARARFAAYVRDPASLPPALYDPVFSVVGRDADQAVYDQLRALGRATTSIRQKGRLYGVLAAAKDPRLARQTLDIALTDELDPGMTRRLVLGVAYGAEMPDLAWQFVQQHRAALLGKQDAVSRVTFVPDLFEAFTDAARADELEADARARAADDAPREVARAAAQIRFNALLKQRALPDVDRWVAAQQGTATH